MKRFIPLIVALVLPATALAQEPAAEDAPSGAPAEAPAQKPDEELFAAKCASCHSVGKGDRVGPDLKNAHERRERDWLVRMVTAPSTMLDSDPIARELLKKFKNVRMPDLGLSAEQVNSLVDLLARCSVETCNLAGVFVPATKATDADVELGRQLFLGTTALTNNGPPCMSCHTARGAGSVIAGGTLAKDLTHVFARLGDEGLDAALRNPAFPLMKDIFAVKALTKEEAFALRSFFSASNRAVGVSQDTYSVLLAGIVGAIFCLVLLNALWSRRLRGIRKPLTQTRGVVS